jgi:SRSO17 transposase
MGRTNEKQRCDLDRFLEPLLPLFGRSERRRWGEFYIQGLLLEGRRKTAAGMARQYDGNEQSLQQFVTDSPWDWMKVRKGLALQMVEDLAPRRVSWIVDETCYPKKGEHSVGVTRQYCGTLGNISNSQSGISISIATDKAAFPLDFELYVPAEWTEDKERRSKVGVPEDIVFRRNWEIGLDIIDTLIGWGIPRGTVIADCAYGEVGEFRTGLLERGLQYAAGVPKTLSVWLEEVDLTRPVHRKELPKPMKVVEVAKSLPRNRWRKVTWREGSKGMMTSRFCRVRVQPARSGKTYSKPEPMQWLVIEWPKDKPEPTKYYLSNLPERRSLKELVYECRMRWPVEQNYRELKDELGLDHFEGRSWMGWHHHMTLTMMAYDFLLTQRLDEGKKGDLGLCRRPDERSSGH